MRKITSLNSRKVFGAYSEAQQRELIPEQACFFTAVAVSMVLPETVYCAFGGPLPPATFAVVVAAGIIWGLLKYYKRQPQLQSIVAAGTKAKAPRSLDGTRKAA
jgi:hypothetical protein